MGSVTFRVSPQWRFDTYNSGGGHTSVDSAFVLDDLLYIYSNKAPLDKNRLMLIIEGNAGPIYVTNTPLAHELIILNTKQARLWARDVYQLAHELTHFVIFHGIQQPQFKWFEETLSELSSYFFLKQMAAYWAASNNQIKRAYADSFLEYVELERPEAEDIKMSDLSDPSSHTSLMLEGYQYDRPKNNYIAQKILPVVENNPAYWRALPFLEKVSNATSFLDFMTKWKAVSPKETGEALSAVTSLFESDH